MRNRKEVERTKKPKPVMDISALKHLMALEPDEDVVNCEYCLYHTQAANEDKRHCKLGYCPYVAERLPFGLVTYREAILATAYEVIDNRFTYRAVKLMGKPDISRVRFMNITHRNYYYYAKEHLQIAGKKMTAQLYLLTANVRLWQQIQNYVSKARVDYEHFKPYQFSDTAYTLFGVAKDMYLNTDYVEWSDLADSHLVSANLFLIICNALAIQRFGEEILTLPIEIKKAERSDAD